MKRSKTTVPREVFRSHASRDARTAARVAEVLRAHGVPVFFSPQSIRGSQQWHDEIGEALLRCDWFLLVLTPHAIESRWVKHEVMYALRSESLQSRIVPLLLRECDPTPLSWTLPAVQYIDFTRRDRAPAYRELLGLWGLGYRS